MAFHADEDVLADMSDPSRWDPAQVAYFKDHQRRWRNREFRLIDFADEWQDVSDKDGHVRRIPLWYPQPLGGTVTIDKAVLFERVDYWPSEAVCKFHASTAHIKYLSGGARAGKSLAGAMEMVAVLLTPGTQQWIVGPEYYNTVKEFRYLADYTVNHEIIGQMIKNNVDRYVDRPEQGDMEIRLDWKNGLPCSWVKCKSSKTLATLLSEELDVILLAEAALIPRDVWENKLRMRLVDRNGMALFPSSPAGTGWSKDLFDRGIDGEDGHFAISVDTRTNPIQSLESIAFWSKGMDHADFEEQVRGKPTPKHGLIYPDFDPVVHVQSWRKDWPRKSWRKVRSMDFGFQDPHCTLWIAFDNDRRAYVYREFYKSRCLMDDVVHAIARAEGRDVKRDPTNGRIRLSNVPGKKDAVRGPCITDWDAQERAELSARGLKCRRANKDVIGGIETVSQALRVQDDGRPRLFIHPSCKNLIREFRDYEWSKEEGDRPKDGNDHALDSLRYGLHSIVGKIMAKTGFGRVGSRT